MKPGNGIHLDPAGVNVTVAPSMGLTVDVNGVAVKPGNGVKLGVTGVEVMTKVGGALLVGGDGVGINCGAGLALSQKQLILSPAMPSRITNTYSVDGEFYWRTFCSCPASGLDCYAELVVTAQGDGFKQRFNLLISLDGNPINNNNRSFVVSVLNAGNKPSDQWAIDNVRLGVGYDGEAYVQAGFTSGSPVPVSVSYSPLDVNGINMHGFEVSNIQFVQGTLSSRASGTMQG
ncbi:hypothetical protein [Pseudomonas chlororaphis]|uniref:hypothetical protein n=1 Tax=Pseudomonas chlororaphis TaxID=587753 RepID=UPI000AC938EC|nr:hypothetical protein [Pseudomonas chlororaphis]